VLASEGLGGIAAVVFVAWFTQNRRYVLEQGPSGSMTTMDNRVGEGQGGVATTYCINSIVLCCVQYLQSTVASIMVLAGPPGLLPPTWTEPTYSQQYDSFRRFWFRYPYWLSECSQSDGEEKRGVKI
jgi:hypothetical protein